MRQFYETEWQNIAFSSFYSMSRHTLADSEFYGSFYRALFEKYPNYFARDEDRRRNG